MADIYHLFEMQHVEGEELAVFMTAFLILLGTNEPDFSAYDDVRLDIIR